MDDIEIISASKNNLKYVSLIIPKGKLVMLAGVSGSSKSSFTAQANWIIDMLLLSCQASKTGKYLADYI